MTYTEFLQKWEQDILPNKEPYIREGQSLINFLGDIWIEEYKRINNTVFDCFHRNDVIPKTLAHLEKVWINYPN